MSVFNLPDLGEGLPDAIIREWFVKAGDSVAADQPLVSMETAKALVDVPSPQAGVIAKLCGDEGDTIDTGEPLIEFEGDAEIVDTHAEVHAAEVAAVEAKSPLIELEGVKRAMVMSMKQSHKEVVPVTIVDDADLNSWKDKGKQDVMLRIVRAMQAACEKEPMLNVHFDGDAMAYRDNKHVNIAVAVDTPHGLYVPVIKDVNDKDDATIRADINRYKEQAQSRSIPQDDLHGGTIMLSNFGSIAGRYANPILVPPMVAILGIGRTRDEVVAVDGKVEIHKIMPLSLTFDHRAVTGGDAIRFLRVVIDALAQ